MTKEQNIRLLTTLSRIEGAILQITPRPADFLFEDLSEIVDLLTARLKDNCEEK